VARTASIPQIEVLSKRRVHFNFPTSKFARGAKSSGVFGPLHERGATADVLDQIAPYRGRGGIT
jgi:hypothetical protein